MRALVALLLVANLGFWAWSSGWFGRSSQGDREPERLSQQMHPELIRVLPPPDAVAGRQAPSLAAGVKLACLEAGPFSPADAGPAEAALRAAVPDVASAAYARVSRSTGGGEMLRIERADGRLQVQLMALAEPALKGRPFERCAVPARP